MGVVVGVVVTLEKPHYSKFLDLDLRSDALYTCMNLCQHVSHTHFSGTPPPPPPPHTHTPQTQACKVIADVWQCNYAYSKYRRSLQFGSSGVANYRALIREGEVLLCAT
jgi:hypothetical protein